MSAALLMSTEELLHKPLSMNECLAVIWEKSLGRAVTVQNHEEGHAGNGRDRTRLPRLRGLREEG